MSTVFPKWSNSVPIKAVLVILVLGATVVLGMNYYLTPKYARVGYSPVQPVSFDHSLHAGALGIDCRYCHSHVDKSPHANVPATNTCMNCHGEGLILPDSQALEPVRVSYETGEPIPWVRVHNLPDFVYFNHAVHVNRGISCASCHGQVNEMEVVSVQQPLSMAWCLECHRQPELHLRPLDEVYNLDWHAADDEAQLEMGIEFKAHRHIDPSTSCSACHR